MFLYALRNKRDIGHVGGDIEANEIDALIAARVADWLARILRTGLSRPEQLEDDDDRLRFVMLLHTLFRQYEDRFSQYRAGSPSVPYRPPFAIMATESSFLPP